MISFPSTISTIPKYDNNKSWQITRLTATFPAVINHMIKTVKNFVTFLQIKNEKDKDIIADKYVVCHDEFQD